MKNISELFEKVPGAVVFGDKTLCPSALITDSRRIVPGALFFAFDGLRTCGSVYAEDAVKRGACAIVVRECLALPDMVTQVVVPDVAQAAALAAAAFHGNPQDSLRLVGVTGTNGKTSVSSIVRFLMMRQCGGDKSWGLIGTVRYELGARSMPSYKTTPEAVDVQGFLAEMRDSDCTGCVMEVSSHAVCQNRVYALPFDVVAFTNLTQDHMDYHGDMESYFSVKSRLFDGSQGAYPRAAILNADDAYGLRLREKIALQTRVFTFGTENEKRLDVPDFEARNIVLGASGSRFTLRYPGGCMEAETSLPGNYNVSNVLCALAIVAALNGDLAQAVEDLKGFNGVAGRMERVGGNPFPFEVFVDYAHTDDALENALGMLKRITGGRLLAVFGCGGNRDRGKRPKMVQAVQRFADFAWATSDNPRKEPLEQIFDDMRSGIVDADKILFEPDRRRAIGLALEAAQPGDVVLIAGKGHETYQEFADVTLPFDDKAVAGELLSLLACRRSV